jgi:hypothetical protein
MEANKPQKSCEERIDQELRKRLDQFLPERPLKSKGQLLTTAEIDAIECASRCDIRVTYKLCLSWVGPADCFELDWSTDSSTWIGGCYIFQDGFDAACRQLSSAQVQALANLFGIEPDAG